jgi:ubiquinone/menaquinone biosynthesis C-methylase UbiE
MQADATVARESAAHAGQAGYTRITLPVYDLFVYRYTLPTLWRCPKERLLQLYDERVGARHLDVGVASGYLIDRARFPTEKPEITLMDMNLSSLRFARRRLRRYSPRTHRANVLEPWGLPGQAFDSVAMCNLLHCLPGTLREKAVAFEHARDVLAPGGKLFGATVLGLDADHTRRSRKAIERLTRGGSFCNLGDRREDLEAGLAAAFPSYEVETEGVVALFTARNDEQGRVGR